MEAGSMGQGRATDGVGVSGLVVVLVDAGEVWKRDGEVVGYGSTWTEKEAAGQNYLW